MTVLFAGVLSLAAIRRDSVVLHRSGSTEGGQAGAQEVVLHLQKDASSSERSGPDAAGAPGKPHPTPLRSILERPPRFTGERIDLNLVDTPLIEAIRLLADIGNFSFVLDPGVTGRVTVHLQGVPWEQALSLILETQGLGFEVEGGMLVVENGS